MSSTVLTKWIFLHSFLQNWFKQFPAMHCMLVFQCVFFLKIVWFKFLLSFYRGPCSSVGIATGYGLYGPGSNPGGGEIFRTCPDRTWGPPSLLYNGYRVFPGGKERPGRAADPSPLLMPWPRKSRATPLLSLWAIRPVQRLSACTRVHFSFFFIILPVTHVTDSSWHNWMNTTGFENCYLMVSRLSETNIFFSNCALHHISLTSFSRETERERERERNFHTVSKHMKDYSFIYFNF